MGTAAALVRFPLGSPDYGMQNTRLSEAGGVATPPAQAEIQVSSSSTATSQPKRLVVILSLLSLYTLWGGTYLGMRVALEGFPPLFVAGFRPLPRRLPLFHFSSPRCPAAPKPAPRVVGP